MILAAKVWASFRVPSDDARRTNRDCRGSTFTMRSRSGVAKIQSPTATSAPIFRTRHSRRVCVAAISPTVTQRNVLHPRSSRFTRPMSWSSLRSTDSGSARRNVSFHPSSLKALCTMTFTLPSCKNQIRVLDCPTSMSYNGILLHVTTTCHR